MDSVDMMTQALSNQEPNALQKLYDADLPTPGGLPFFGTPSRMPPTDLEKWHMARRPIPDYARPAPGWGDAARDFLSVAPMLMGSPTMRPGTGVAPSFTPPRFNSVPVPEAGHRPLYELMGRAMIPANSSNRLLQDLPMQHQLEYQRLAQSKDRLLNNKTYEGHLTNLYNSPYDRAAYEGMENRMQDLRDLVMRYKQAKKLGIKVIPGEKD